jgi:choline dehydrogenase-like flavoprotein
VVAPKSVGSLTLASAEGGTFTQPLINLNLYADPFDVHAMLQAINDAETFLSTTPWTQDNFIISVVGRNSTSIGTTEEKIAFMRNNSLTVYHPIGTARMGAKEDSVTDSRLRVRGVKGVRVVDASVFVSGFIFLPSMNKRQTGAIF